MQQAFRVLNAKHHKKRRKKGITEELPETSPK
jgi:hypothetical protein